jgi:hypothetical protein
MSTKDKLPPLTGCLGFDWEADIQGKRVKLSLSRDLDNLSGLNRSQLGSILYGAIVEQEQAVDKQLKANAAEAQHLEQRQAAVAGHGLEANSKEDSADVSELVTPASEPSPEAFKDLEELASNDTALMMPAPKTEGSEAFNKDTLLDALRNLKPSK